MRKLIFKLFKRKITPNIILVTGALRRVFEDDKVKIFNSLYVLKDSNLLHYDKKVSTLW